jgi:hypothetical protein
LPEMEDRQIWFCCVHSLVLFLSLSRTALPLRWVFKF